MLSGTTSLAMATSSCEAEGYSASCKGAAVLFAGATFALRSVLQFVAFSLFGKPQVIAPGGLVLCLGSCNIFLDANPAVASCSFIFRC